MPVDFKKFKSFEVITDESKIVDAVIEAEAAFKKMNPLRASADPTQTELRTASGRPLIAKRSDYGPMAVADAAIPAADELAKLAAQRGFEWKDGHEDRVVRYWASDARGDRHGDVVDQTWKFDEYESNPIMLFSHDWGMPPIGGTLDWDVRQRTSKGYSGDALSLLSLFADADTSEYADSLFRLVKAGFLKAGSVGFFPERVIEVRDKAERKELGLADWGLLYCDNRLVEWSPCSVPANPGAHRTLAAAKSAGMLKPIDMLTVRELRRQESLATDEGRGWKRDDAILLGIGRSLFPGTYFPEHKDAEVPIIVEDVADAPTMVSLSSVADMLEVLQRGMSERLGNIEQRQDDIVFELQQTQETMKGAIALVKKTEPEPDDEPAWDSTSDVDVLGAATKILATRT